jgi:hypothetical protein
MSDMIQFPCPSQPAAKRRAADQITIPFSRAQLLEVAKHLAASTPEIIDAIERHGGSPSTLRFLDYLHELSGGELPEVPAACRP